MSIIIAGAGGGGGGGSTTYSTGGVVGDMSGLYILTRDEWIKRREWIEGNTLKGAERVVGENPAMSEEEIAKLPQLPPRNIDIED